MTTPSEQEQTDLANLIQALVYAQGVEAVIEALAEFAGVAIEAVKLLFEIPQVMALVRLSPRAGAHAVIQATYRLNAVRRASYLVQASRRLTTANGMGREALSRALVVERRWLRQHLDAQARRQTAAEDVARLVRSQQREAKQAGLPLDGRLGWYAVMDERTSAECRRANGRNFYPRQIPPIGLPGTVHPNCRCVAGPPHATNLRVEDIRPQAHDRVRRSRGRRVPLGA